VESGGKSDHLPAGQSGIGCYQSRSHPGFDRPKVRTDGLAPSSEKHQ
jgi:hypothetical protein